MGNLQLWLTGNETSSKQVDNETIKELRKLCDLYSYYNNE